MLMVTIKARKALFFTIVDNVVGGGPEDIVRRFARGICRPSKLSSKDYSDRDRNSNHLLKEYRYDQLPR